MKKSELQQIIREEISNVLNEMPLITKKGKTAYADGKPLKLSNVEELDKNIIMYHEKQGNWFIAKDTIMLWFVDNEDYIDKLNNGEYDIVTFPIRTSSNAFTVSPITDVWKLSKSRGKKEVLGMINAYLYKDELVIEMMSVRGAWQGNRINSLMIDSLKSSFPGKTLAFEDPTKDGWAFIEKYAPDAKVYKDGKVVQNKVA